MPQVTESPAVETVSAPIAPVAPAPAAAATVPAKAATNGSPKKVAKKAAPKAATKKAPVKSAKAPAAKTVTRSNKQPSPFLTTEGGSQMPWNADNKALVKAMTGTKSGDGKTVVQLAKSSKLEEQRVNHYIYHGVKGAIIGVDKMEGEAQRRFYLTAKGRAINLDKVSV